VVDESTSTLFPSLNEIAFSDDADTFF
jgi:hypothetical protein